MRIGIASLVLVVAVLVGFLAGWLAPGGRDTAAAVVATRGMSHPTLSTDRTSDTTWAIGDLAAHLSQASGPATGGDPEAAPPPVKVAPLPPPPPPDPAVIFRSELTAVLSTGQGMAAVLREPGGDGPQARTVKIGDVVTGRWRLQQLSMNEAVLDDGRNQRRIALNGAAGERQ